MNHIDFERRCNLLLKRKSSQTEQFPFFPYSISFWTLPVRLHIYDALSSFLLRLIRIIDISMTRKSVEETESGGLAEKRAALIRFYEGNAQIMSKISTTSIQLLKGSSFESLVIYIIEIDILKYKMVQLSFTSPNI